MADYFVKNGGDGTAPSTWAGAYGSLAAALAAATTAGDRIIIQYDAVPSTDLELSADTTYTLAANVHIISSTNSGTATITPTAMGAPSSGNWIGNSTTNRGIIFAGAYTANIYGVTFRISGSSADSFSAMNTDSGQIEYEQCRFVFDNTSGTSKVYAGSSAAGTDSTTIFNGCVFKFGNAGQGIIATGTCKIIGGSVDSAGSAPTTLFQAAAVTGSPSISCNGFNISHCTGTLLATATSAVTTAVFENCQLGAGLTYFSASRTNLSGGEVFLFNCNSGDNHYAFIHQNAFGTTAAITSPYANDGALYDGTNHVTWQIDTTANCSFFTPYYSPWIEKYHSGTSEITPYLEVLRNGSTNAYTNAQVWGEFSAQVTTGSTNATISSDRMAIAGAPANQTAGVGVSGWTNENASAWSGKVDSGSAMTPAEIGMLRGRVCVAVNTDTTPLLVDPKIRT